MRWNRFAMIGGGVLLLMQLGGGVSHAEFSLHPGLYLRLEWTDNLYLSNANLNDELIATVTPTLWMARHGKLLDFEIDYAYEMYRYLNEPSLNDRADSHLGTLSGTILPRHDFNIELYGDARLDNIDTRQSDIVDSPTLNTTNRYLGRVRPNYLLKLGSRHEIELAYAWEVIRYDDEFSDDTDSQKVELAARRRQSARMDIRLEGFYEQLEARINSDYERLQGMGGGEWRPFSSTTLTAMGGASWFEFAEGENFNARVLDVRLVYQSVRRWGAGVSYVETFDYDVRDGLYQAWRGEAWLAYISRLSWRLSLIQRDDDYVQINRDDREQGVIAEATYQLTPKVLLGLRGDNRSLKFDPDNEDVNRYSAGASVEYKMRESAIFGCRYTYRNSDSNIDINDYAENRVGCDLRLTYAMIP